MGWTEETLAAALRLPTPPIYVLGDRYGGDSVAVWKRRSSEWIISYWLPTGNAHLRTRSRLHAARLALSLAAVHADERLAKALEEDDR